MSEAVAHGAPARPWGAADNAGLLLELLRDGSARTTTELATALGVARSTVLQRLEALGTLGLVSADSTNSGARGRPAALFRFRPDAALVLTAHVGLSGSRVAATDLQGEVIVQRFVNTSVAAGPDALLGDLVRAFDELVRDAGRSRDQVAGIGVGLPSSSDLLAHARGGAPSPDHVLRDWDRLVLERELQRLHGAPTFIDLDVNLLALAESRKSWPEDEVFVCVKLGTLISAAVVVNGQPVRGVDGLAGELGHLKVSGATAPCTCGARGCLDAVASGRAIVAQLASQGLEVRHVSDAVALVRAGEPRAVAAVREAGRAIGEVLASVVNLLNPGVVTAWGYLTEAETTLFAGIREGLYQAALPRSSRNLRLVRTALGDLAGVRGAALMVIDQVLSPRAVDQLVSSGSWSRTGAPQAELG